MNLRILQHVKVHRPQSVWIVLSALFATVGLLYFVNSATAELPQRSIVMSDNTAGANATYVLSFTLPSPENLGSIKLQICSDSPIIGTTCVAPIGFSIAAATLSAQSGEMGFVVYPAGTDANTMVINRIPGVTTAVNVSYTFTNITNPSSNATYYGRLQTFASTDASGPENDHGGLAFSINDAAQLSATVPPYLLFCTGVTIPSFDCSTASGDYINFGNLLSTSTASAQSQMVTATNGKNGYGIQVYGSTMTSGNNVLSALTIPDVSRPGTSQFGMNAVANQTPKIGADPQGPGAAGPVTGYNQANWYKFVSGSTLVTVPTADDYRLLTVSYIVNIPIGQTPGVYVATLNYVCLANF